VKQLREDMSDYAEIFRHEPDLGRNWAMGLCSKPFDHSPAGSGKKRVEIAPNPADIAHDLESVTYGVNGDRIESRSFLGEAADAWARIAERKVINGDRVVAERSGVVEKLEPRGLLGRNRSFAVACPATCPPYPTPVWG
jgi:hypothetical protein